MTETEVKILSFYIASLYDILEGEEITNLKCIIKDFEEVELYEECEGIKRAIEFTEKHTVDQIKEEYNEQILNQYGY